MRPCPECQRDVPEQATTCSHCGARVPAKGKSDGWGYEYKSKATLFGLPWLHISFKWRGWRPVPAKGIIAIGQFAIGLVTLAQFGLGLFSVSQVTIAGYALAQVAVAYSMTAQVGISVHEGPSVADLLQRGPSTQELETVEYTPLPGDDWKVSTPAEQGLDPRLVAELYYDAAELETLYGLLVIKNGHLIAEGYFNEGSVGQLSNRQSMTKSVTSALVGIALEQGHLSSVDQKMMDFFPEFAGQIDDPRKEQITIRDMLQMRAGYPNEERTPPYLDLLFFSDNWHHVPHLVDFPLLSGPGTEYSYSNLTSHLLGAIVARASGTDLRSYAQEHLFTPIGAEVGDWYADADGYNLGCIGIFLTARDMAKFGALYFHDGAWEGKQVVSADWVSESLQRYSEKTHYSGWFSSKKGRYIRDVGYGYQWWSARAGDHRFDYAAGHGGNLIILLDDLDMIIVTTADPLHELPGEKGWKYEGAIIDVVGKFIKSLPSE
jgi:CubicO group peptidase (beta-lactamase class C family)